MAATSSAAAQRRPQLTARAILTGLLLGTILTPCNVYAGLKIGWAFNMSIAAALLSYGAWALAARWGTARPWGLLENNINQTTASAAASIVSAGLVAPIPALTLLTGQELPWPWLAFWVLTVSLLGVALGVGLRRHMLEVEALTFPAGVATAETVREIYARGQEAAARIRMLLGGGLAAASLKLASDHLSAVSRVAPPISWPIGGASAQNLGFALDPSLLMVGFGAIVGLRVGLSLLLGAILAWGVLGPWALGQGWAQTGEASVEAVWFSSLVKWLLWPGVTLMVTASVTWVVLAWRRQRGARASDHGDRADTLSWRGWWLGLAASAVLVVWAQTMLFTIPLYAAVMAVALSLLLAAVAARIAGETGINPIGGMGKITQLTFAFAAPGNVTSNLMAANVTGGAAGQCADLLHDLKAGLLLGASPRAQATGQAFGVVAGSLAGSAAYLVLIPDPRAMLITEQWPAPAVATWKAVAEVLQGGLGALPEASVPAMTVAGLAGILMATAERRLPARVASRLPSAPAIGLAFVIPAWNSFSMCLGAVAATLVMRIAPAWGGRFLLALAAGLVAGESLAGLGSAVVSLLTRS